MRRPGSARRRARELALRILYQAEVSGETIPTVISEVIGAGSPEAPATGADAGATGAAGDGDPGSASGAGSEPPAEDSPAAYAAKLAQAVERRRDEIDGLIARFSERWALERMATIDRNVLRLATAELLAFPDVDAPVVIDEAVAVAGKFGGDDSGGFVNGVLDRIARDVRPGELKAR